ncbi:MAG: TetR/AcrR family transcriptional regulator [Acetobacteraceae bacterium]|nr:TetR/AcrR family transcriptional regulator [Acetobacteraceae bacterium]
MPEGTLPARRRLPPAARLPQLLDAAFEEFAAQGYAGATMTGVAARAGVAKGLVYHYFPTKEALFRAVVQAAIEPAFAAAEREVAASGRSATEMLRALFDIAYAPPIAEDRQRLLFRMMLAEAERFPEISAWYEETVLRRESEIIGALLRHGVRSGEFRPDIAEREGMAEVLFGPVIAGEVWHMLMGEGRAPARDLLREAHWAMVMAALRA